MIIISCPKDGHIFWRRVQPDISGMILAECNIALDDNNSNLCNLPDESTEKWRGLYKGTWRVLGWLVRRGFKRAEEDMQNVIKLGKSYC